MYPLLALLKGELVPGPGHVSLASAIAFQLGGRQGTGSPLDPSSQAHSLIAGWLHLDPWLLVAGALCIPVGLAVRRFRPVALAQGIALLDVVHGGYLPVPYVISLLPFGALLVAAAGSTLQSLSAWPADHRPRAGATAGLTLGAAGALLVFLVPSWAAGLRPLNDARMRRPRRRRRRPGWSTTYPAAIAFSTDDTVWVDLVDHRFDQPLGWSGSTSSGT